MKPVVGRQAAAPRTGPAMAAARLGMRPPPPGCCTSAAAAPLRRQARATSGGPPPRPREAAHRMPAALAAASPMRESSITTHRAGSTPSSCGGWGSGAHSTSGGCLEAIASHGGQGAGKPTRQRRRQSTSARSLAATQVRLRLHAPPTHRTPAPWRPAGRCRAPASFWARSRLHTRA